MNRLIILRGLPGTGKTTLAAALARARGYVHLRIDTIEQAVRDALGLGWDIGPAGYAVAYALAKDNLKPGLTVIADCVNPIPLTRAAWRAVATEAGVPSLEIEVTCSDEAEHRARAETRDITAPNLRRVTWAEIQQGAAEEYDRAPADITVDTAGRPVDDCLVELIARL